MSRPFSRRSFLKGASAIPFAIPLLQSLDARAEDGVFPKRLIIFFHPNGTVPDNWFPTAGASETDFTLGPIHQPLLPYKSKMVLFKGMDLKVATDNPPGEPHQRGMGAVLTGTPLNQGPFVGGTGETAGWAQGKSVDQRIADAIGMQTRFRSLQLGIRGDDVRSEVRTRLNYAGENQPLPPVNDPRQVFDSLFGGTNNQDQAARLRAQRRSVLDGVQEQFTRLHARLPASERDKLEAHLTMVRELETRLSMGPDVVECTAPVQPNQMEVDSENTMVNVARDQIDLLVAALACDLTRVATLQFSTAINAIRTPWLSQAYNSTYDGHGISHMSDAASRQALTERDTWFAGQLRYLLDRLSLIPEGDGSVLDNTVVFWCNELSLGNIHSQTDMPFMLVGSAGGYFNTGRYLQLNRMPHNNLLVALLNAFGIEETTFGRPEYCTGAIPGLVA